METLYIPEKSSNKHTNTQKIEKKPVKTNFPKYAGCSSIYIL
jgi:hypothetical protein